MWSPSATVVGSALVFILAGWRIYQKFSRQVFDKEPRSPQQIPSPKEKGDFSAYNDILPLPDFDWSNTEPLKQRPFKEKYHLTMGLTNCTFSDLVQMDKTYVSRLSTRKEIMRDHRDIVLQASPEAKLAVDELYTYLTSTYLPMRFPTMFRLGEKSLKNLVTKEEIPLAPSADPVKSLEILGGNIDEDFVLLLPSDDGDGYALKAYVLCFPSGFNTLEKFSLKLRDIHKPVPGYKEKLELSMDRYFANLPCGRIVKRANWAITTHSQLFMPSGNHLYAGEEVNEDDMSVDIENTYMRSERQLLWRLPETKAIVFSFETYLYSLRMIKEEGSGEELAGAIDGLKAGSVPQMYFYKKGVVWGETVKEFLRS